MYHLNVITELTVVIEIISVNDIVRIDFVVFVIFQIFVMWIRTHFTFAWAALFLSRKRTTTTVSYWILSLNFLFSSFKVIFPLLKHFNNLLLISFESFLMNHSVVTPRVSVPTWIKLKQSIKLYRTLILNFVCAMNLQIPLVLLTVEFVFHNW